MKWFRNRKTPKALPGTVVLLAFGGDRPTEFVISEVSYSDSAGVEVLLRDRASLELAMRGWS